MNWKVLRAIYATHRLKNYTANNDKTESMLSKAIDDEKQNLELQPIKSPSTRNEVEVFKPFIDTEQEEKKTKNDDVSLTLEIDIEPEPKPEPKIEPIDLIPLKEDNSMDNIPFETAPDDGELHLPGDDDNIGMLFCFCHLLLYPMNQ